MPAARDSRAYRDRVKTLQHRVLRSVGVTAELSSTPADARYYLYERIPLLLFRGTSAQLQALARNPDVSRIRLFDPTPMSIDEPGVPFVPKSGEAPGPTAVQVIGADQAHLLGAKGAGEVVVVIDTGFAAGHPYFKHYSNGKLVHDTILHEICISNILGRAKFEGICTGPKLVEPARSKRDKSGYFEGRGAASHSCRPPTRLPAPALPVQCDHGTHVAGIIAGYAKGAHVSAAPQARLFLIKTGVLNKAKDRIEILEEDLLKIYDIIKRYYNREIDRHGERGYLEICAPEAERPGKRCGFFTAINLSIGAPPGNCGKRAGNLFYEERNFYRVYVAAAAGNDGLYDKGLTSWPACSYGMPSVGATHLDAPEAFGGNNYARVFAPGVGIGRLQEPRDFRANMIPSTVGLEGFCGAGSGRIFRG